MMEPVMNRNFAFMYPLDLDGAAKVLHRSVGCTVSPPTSSLQRTTITLCIYVVTAVELIPKVFQRIILPSPLVTATNSSREIPVSMKPSLYAPLELVRYTDRERSGYIPPYIDPELYYEWLGTDA